MFVATKLCLSRQSFVATNICRDKRVFVATNTFCSDKNMFVATNVLLRQKYVYSDKSFVATSIVLSRRVLSRQTRVCRDETFVATKILLVAAPATDSLPAHTARCWGLLCQWLPGARPVASERRYYQSTYVRLRCVNYRSADKFAGLQFQHFLPFHRQSS